MPRQDWRDRYPHLAPRHENDMRRIDIKRVARFLTTGHIDDVEAARDNQPLIRVSF